MTCSRIISGLCESAGVPAHPLMNIAIEQSAMMRVSGILRHYVLKREKRLTLRAISTRFAKDESESQRSRVLASAAIRIHRHISLSLPATDDGAGVVHRFLEMEGASHRRGAICEGGAILDENLRAELQRRRGDRDSNGVSIWDE